MCRVRVWALESQYDTNAVKQIAERLKSEPNVIVRIADDYVPVPRKRRKKMRKEDKVMGREAAVRRYLQQDDYVILVVDSDNYATEKKRRNEPNSLRNQAEKIVRLPEFDGKVFLAVAVTEIEAWLLTDCVGIFQYFAKQLPATRNISREQIVQKKSYKRLIDKYQSGNTEMIVGAEQGKKGSAKNYLIQFSREIVRTINPQMKDRNVDEKRYRERLSSKIAETIQIGHVEMRRNRSFHNFGQIVGQICQSGEGA